MPRRIRLTIAAVGVAISVLAVAVTSHVAFGRGTSSSTLTAGLRAGRHLSEMPAVRTAWPELAAFGAAIGADNPAAAKAIGDQILATGGLAAHAAAVVAAYHHSHLAAPGAPQLAVVQFVGRRIQPQIQFGSLSAIICPILSRILAAFPAFVAAIIAAIFSAFGCSPSPTTTTAPPTSTSSSSSSTSTTQGT